MYHITDAKEFRNACDIRYEHDINRFRAIVAEACLARAACAQRSDLQPLERPTDRPLSTATRI